ILPTLTPEQAASVETYEKIGQGFLGMPVAVALQLFTAEIASQPPFAEDGSDLKWYATSIQKPQDRLRIMHALPGGFSVYQDTAGDTTYLDFSFPATDPKTGEKRRDSYSIAVTPNMILAAPRKAAVREAMARLSPNPSAKPAAGLTANPEFT